jgi:hypothetical protein
MPPTVAYWRSLLVLARRGRRTRPFLLLKGAQSPNMSECDRFPREFPPLNRRFLKLRGAWTLNSLELKLVFRRDIPSRNLVNLLRVSFCRS